MNLERFIEVIPIAYNSAKKFKDNNVDLDTLYKIFDSEQLTTREKRNYLFGLPTLSRRSKDTIWNAYTGDNLNEYANIPDIEYTDFMEEN